MEYDNDSAEVRAALNDLIDQIRRGAEFPDIAPRIAKQYGIPLNVLERAYDAD